MIRILKYGVGNIFLRSTVLFPQYFGNCFSQLREVKNRQNIQAEQGFTVKW